MFGSNKSGTPSQDFWLQVTETQLKLALAKREFMDSMDSWDPRNETSKPQGGGGCRWAPETTEIRK